MANIVSAFLQEEKDNGLQLTDKTGHHVELVLKKNRKEEFLKLLKEQKPIVSSYCIKKDKKLTFTIEIDLILRRVRCSTSINITKGKAKAQTTNLINLLSKTGGISDQIEIEAKFPRKQNTSTALLSDLIKQKEDLKPYSLLDNDLGDTIKCFDVELAKDLKSKFNNKTQFIIYLEKYSLEFFNQVMQEIIT